MASVALASVASMAPMEVPARRREWVRGLVVLFAIAAAGLFYVKWGPYYHRAQTVFVTHSMGRSLVFVQGLVTPPPTVAAAFGYAVGYFKAIWQAWVLAFLLAATVETLLPRDRIAAMLGKLTLRSAVIGGSAGLPGMM